ncbi:MAG: NTPase [Promethearchaeota archaeon]
MPSESKYKHILITGRPGIGKTTLIKKIVTEIKRLRPNWHITGFYTSECRQKGRRIGFDIHTLDGQQGVLARLIDTEFKSNFRVGKYSVDVTDLNDIAVPLLYQQAELVIIDELGKMELFSPQFREAVEYALDNQSRILATIPYYENIFLTSIKHKSSVQIWELNRSNQKKVFEKIVELFK